MASRTDAEVLESLRLLRDDWITAYRAAVTLATTAGVRPDYSVGGQSVSWQSVYTNGAKIIEDLLKLINAMSWQGGPIETHWRP